MPLVRQLCRFAGLAMLIAGTAAAHGRVAGVVAWKPRAWQPPAGTASAGIAIDPVDGVLGVASMAAASRTAGIRLPETFRADGSRRVQLDDRFAEFEIVTIGPDGRPVVACFHGLRAAHRAVLGPPCPPEPAPVVDR